jgi:hypothetical protein
VTLKNKNKWPDIQCIFVASALSFYPILSHTLVSTGSISARLKARGKKAGAPFKSPIGPGSTGGFANLLPALVLEEKQLHAHWRQN